MQLNEYQTRAHETAVYDPDVGIVYNLTALAAEIGEVSAVYAKWLRGDYSDAEMLRRLKLELGDVLWHLSGLALSLDLSLEDVAQANLDKLARRQQAGALRGDGDYR